MGGRVFQSFEKAWIRLKSEHGSISLFVLIMMIVLLPYTFWVGVHLPQKIQATYAIKQMAMNTADSIITRLDESALSDGRVRVDVEQGMEIADLMIRGTLNLDENYNPSGEGLLKERVPVWYATSLDRLDTVEDDGRVYYKLPEETGVYVYFLNEPERTFTILTENGPIEIANTSVVVRANVPIETGGLASRTMITKTGVSEVTLNESGG